MSNDNKTGAEGVRWDRSQLYADLNDPKIDQDIAKAKGIIEKIGSFKGTLSADLGQVLTLMQQLERTAYDLYVYPMLLQSEDPSDVPAQQMSAKVSEAISPLQAEHMTYVDLEIGNMDDAEYENLLNTDPVVKHHQPMLDKIRENAKYQLSEDAESMLQTVSPFGPGVMKDYANLLEAELEFMIPDEQTGEEKALRLTESLKILDDSKNREYRAKVIKIINATFAEKKFDRFVAKAMNANMGQMAVLQKTRGYDPANPMQAKNIGNMIDDATVEALHEAGKTRGADACARFYALKRDILNKADGTAAGTPLEWSDRNAPMPLKSDDKVSWADCMEMVRDAYGAFSPTLLDLVETIENENWIDAPYVPGKQSGAYNCSGPYSGGNKSWNFLNYLGTRRDVMTVAHELGHGVHGMLALEEQGELMWHAPMPYAETASVFGEMLTFTHMLNQPMSDAERLDLLMGKINDFMNTVERQLSFSEFERAIHTHRRTKGELSIEDFNQYFMGVSETFYGKNGEVFNYDEEQMNRLWCYVSHFFNPFYVYAYAFGELFTQALFAKRAELGAQFEPMYLDLLRAGGTKSAVELTKPFGLDPTKPEFWNAGFDVVEDWIAEAEQLAKKLNMA
ncbi:MAG: M3 family metallopeptidase [Pseudomonadota bacterium]|nr:M3 family metallopeptidase [Pseudomonadota bacterium]